MYRYAEEPFFFGRLNASTDRVAEYLALQSPPFFEGRFFARLENRTLCRSQRQLLHFFNHCQRLTHDGLMLCIHFDGHFGDHGTSLFTCNKEITLFFYPISEIEASVTAWSPDHPQRISLHPCVNP